MSGNATIAVIARAARKAAKGILRDFGEIEKLQISKKGVSNFVTNADIRTEKILIEELMRDRPSFGFLTEESGVLGPENPKQRFVIDPIDGTTNFIHAIPYISISIAVQTLTDAGWETTIGVVYDPVHDELFTAEKGAGAFLNNYKLRVSKRTEDVMLSTSSPRTFRKDYEAMLAAFGRVTAAGALVRCSGSAALDLAYLAAGRIDGLWYFNLNAWDMAAGILLAQEAGGKATAMNGEEVNIEGGSLLATNGLAHPGLVKLLGA